MSGLPGLAAHPGRSRPHDCLSLCCHRWVDDIPGGERAARHLRFTIASSRIIESVLYAVVVAGIFGAMWLAPLHLVLSRLEFS